MIQATRAVSKQWTAEARFGGIFSQWPLRAGNAPVLVRSWLFVTFWQRPRDVRLALDTAAKAATKSLVANSVLIDHVIGAAEDRRRDREAERTPSMKPYVTPN